MANTFKNANDVIASTNTEVYTTPASTTAIVIGSSFANVHATNPSTLTIYIEDSSGAVTRTVVPGIPLPVATSFSFTPDMGKVVLEAGDKLIAKSSENNGVEATLHLLEIS